MPFHNQQASLDTNILYYFHAVGRLDLLWALFPEGNWIDPAVLHEIREGSGPDIEIALREQGLAFHVERRFEDRDYVEMAEIKARHPGLKHADIVTIVVAGKHGITCLSSDAPVCKTCGERNIPFARHLGCLEEAVRRGLIDGESAIALMDGFLEEGLYLPASLVDEFRRKHRSS